MSRTLDRLERQSRALDAEQAKLQTVLRRPENAEVLERSLFLNRLLFAKGISWTRMFSDLGKVMPYNVRLISIRPQVIGESTVSLDLVVGSETAEPVIQMLARLENQPQFGGVQVHTRTPPSQGEPLLRYRISVNYEQKL
jgi:type IV pilus assembly protein PilN